MSKDQLIGLALVLGSIIGVIIYAWLLFFWNPQIILQLTAFIIIVGGLSIVGWIGYTLATTPPPKPIEDIEKEIEKEMKAVQSEEAGPAPSESK